ncbi:Gfo/Idh/MocA family oxidoreductase [Larkinella knui]|uniref:Gfo/Idh/MocA family oxidoreductase n=1 Tax=Larkinella knui TaxID=2025310 RepID=A0A3P1C9G8_9BACT|nr:Gfo/Idh/MocA family oxidoreductase [Larkinella knui]RRB09907.1 gfo/Idh/MocA family oxidoreductase [Larkinella knui]
MANTLTRRDFSILAASAGLGAYLQPFATLGSAPAGKFEGKKVGIIGLDTSHSTAFAKELNNPTPNPDWLGYRVVAAYPKGSNDIESSVKRIPGYIEEVKKLGVEIVNSIDDLLSKVDVVLLETNDGRLHREQAAKVFAAGKRVFIDKPIAASLSDAIAIFEMAKKKGIPVFSASSLRYIKGIQGLDKSQVVGADTYSPAVLEKTHPDLFWYGVHGVETLFTAMGPGCQSVIRVNTPDTDIVIGTWSDGRVGTFRGTRTGKHEYGGTVYTKNGNVTLGPYGGYNPLLKDIIHFFETGETPVKPEETLEIFAFMEAADESKRQGGAAVTLASVMKKAQKSS